MRETRSGRDADARGSTALRLGRGWGVGRSEFPRSKSLPTPHSPPSSASANVTARTAACPNCGATIEFRWSGAVQTICPYCKAVLVRRDLDLEKVGMVSDLPPTASPIQLGTEGKFEGDAFVVVGRIVYQ